MLGIIGAMEQEVAKLKEHMEDVSILTEASMDFYKGKLRGKDTVIVQSGVGKVNAAICAQILVDRFQVDRLINTGIAGSLKTEINIGDIVLSTDLVQHDVDAVSFGYQLGQIPGMKVLSFQGDEHMRQVAQRCCEKVIPETGIYQGRIVSGDQFISSKEKKEWIVDTFGGYCTEMEGAAIAQAAWLNHIPFIVIRAISDKADDSAHMDYPAFENMAIERTVKLMLEMAGEL